MNCPKCGFARPLADSVCRRCKYVFEEDRFLQLAPPRAKGGREPGRFFSQRTGIYLGDLRMPRWLPSVASLIPGLGHLMQGRPWAGLLYLVLVGLFGTLSLMFFGQTSGQMFFGMAVSTHATCILETTPWGRSPDVLPRMLAMGAILSGLMFLYWPTAVSLADKFVARQTVQVDGRYFRPIQGGEQMLLLAALFVITILVSAWLGRILSSKEQ